MLYSYTVLLSVVVIFCGLNTALAGEIKLGATTPFGENAVIREAVKNECQLQTKLPDFVRQFANKYNIDVKLGNDISKKTKGRVLLLEIVGTQGAAGGAWSGAKAVQVKGGLYDNGKLVGDFVAARYSGGGMWGAYKGTCSILGRCVKTLGKDIAKWLQNPSKNSRLGDF